MSAFLFQDRADAARQLIAALPPDIDDRWLVLGLPRGGVPIAAAIAHHLGADLDLLIVRKVGAPGNPELAIAAVTGPGEDQIAFNRSVQKAFGLSDAETRRLAARPIKEVEDRRALWTSSRDPQALRNRDVLVVDDGAATGTTLEAALNLLRRQGTGRIAVALPVALSGALGRLSKSGEHMICLHHATQLSAVGSAYRHFPQVPDDEVSELLSEFGATTE